MIEKRVALVGKNCVACGCCISHCCFGAISIANGVSAKIAKDKCVGCGKCERECPAGIITVCERRKA